MKNETYKENHSFIERILDHKALILILIGFLIRIFMLLFYYYRLPSNWLRWGDLGKDFVGNYYYPPISLIFSDFGV